MNDDMDHSLDKAPESSRRDFLKGITALPFLSMLTGKSWNQSAADTTIEQLAHPAPKNEKRFVAIQVGARSFLDEGVDRVLDTFQKTAGVNVVMPAVFTYGRGLSGRQVPGQPLPDHGVQEYDEVHGGSYSKIHPEFYEKSVIKDFRAPELGEFDVLADVIPPAKARGMRVYCLFEEAYNPQLIPDFEKIAEVDVYGRVGTSTCLNNPDARTFLTSMVRDW